MNLKIYDNRSGYRPSSRLKEWWLLMPQNSTTVQRIGTFESEKVPAVFGEPKNLLIHFILVAILIFAELVLILQLEDNGVDFNVLLILSIIDFVVALLPLLVIKFIFKITPAEINARVFIEDVKRYFNEEDSTIGENERIRRRNLYEDQRQKYRKKLKQFAWLSFSGGVFIFGFSIWKFISFYEVLGEEIFLIPIGRFVMGVIFLSIVVHLMSTKTVFVALFFYAILGKELKSRRKNLGAHAIPPTERNKPQEIIGFPGNYKTALALNQRIAQQINYQSLASNDIQKGKDPDIILLKWDEEVRYYRTQNFNGDKNICLIYTGLLTDPELEALSTTQNPNEKLAVLATGKDIQLSQ